MPALREEIHSDPGKRRGDVSALPARDDGGRSVKRMRLAGHARHLEGCRAITELLYRVRNPGVRSRRCVDRCFATESRIPTAKHCGMFRHEPRGACVRRSGGLARRFRHQTARGCNHAQTIGGEAVAGAPGFRHRVGACVSHAQGRQRSAGGADSWLTRFSTPVMARHAETSYR